MNQQKVDSKTIPDSSVDNSTTKEPQNAKGSGSNKGKGKANPKSSGTKTASGSTKQTPGFAEGNQILANYGLSVSGQKERILSPFKADKFFHMVEQSWHALLALKPHLTERFSYAEFRHASALQLYHRIESVKFDALGIKPSAPTRIPLPRTTRVFQPIWSALANIGIVDDDDLRVIYIPDGILPKTEDLTDPEDIENLLSCTLYDWHTSWEDVKQARQNRPEWQARDGYAPTVESNETPQLTKEELIESIAEARRNVSEAKRLLTMKQYKVIDGNIYRYPTKTIPDPKLKGKEKEGNGTATIAVFNYDADDDEISEHQAIMMTPERHQQHLQDLYAQARASKEKRITPKFDVSFTIDSYRLTDGSISADAGAYGTRLHWDPQLWLQYEQLVEIVTPLAMFSLSMPAESSGTYAWVLPVEKRNDTDSSVSVKLPKASIPPVTWIMSMLLQSSTLPFDRRSTFYVETDRLTNVLGLRQRYIRAAIKDPSAVEQYGTY